MFAHLPRWALIAAGGLFLVFWLAAGTSSIGMGGNAGVRDGQYVLDDHGTVTVVDKATYDHHVAKQQRLALGVQGGLGVGAATVCTATITRPVSKS